MRKSYTIEDYKIYFKKDCKSCIHLNVCKFHASMKETCSKAMMYQMNEYDLHNNNLEVFEIHSSCQYFKTDFKELTTDMIYDIAKFYEPRNFQLFHTSYNKEKNDVIFTGKFHDSNENEKIGLKMEDILAKYEIVNR